jgi:outer membrane protein insertion porin family
MKLITFFFITLSFIFTLSVRAEVVNDVIVNNNDRISLNTIKTYGDIKIGTDYTKKDLNEVLKNLYETKFFNDITLNIKNNILIINVIENKLIQSINITGIKSTKIKNAVLERLSMTAKSPFIESQVEKDIMKIKFSLNYEGFYFADVTSSVEKNLNNTVNLNYNIDLKDKVKISKIEFTGKKIIKDRTLRNLITIEESKFWKFLSKKKYLNKQNLLRDERLLRKYYLDRGYYDVIVNTSTAVLLDNNSFNVTYNINAGNIYKIGKTKLVLPIDYDKKNFLEVLNLLDKIKGKNYSFYGVSKIVKAIDKISLSREYDFITAEIDEEKTLENKINLTFIVSETEKLYVEQVNIFGNNITEGRVIRDQLEVDEGDPFNELLQAKSINQIKSLRIFKSVKSEVIDGSSPVTKIININVEEKPTGEISLGAGVGTTGGSLGFSIAENNFLGKAVKLKTSLKLGADSVRGNFLVENPNFNYSGRSLFTNIESSKTDKLKVNGYETSKIGFTVGTAFEEYENLYLRPNISVFSEKINTNSTASSALKKQEGNFFETKLHYDIDHDLRDRTYQTTAGTRSVFSQGIPLYSDDNSLYNSYGITKWHKFYNDMISDLSFKIQAINSLTDKDVKISKRLGISSSKLRGFEAGKIGPRDGTDYVGGNYAMSVNLNTTLPMILPSFENIDFKFFIDAGNLWGVDYSDTIQDSNTIRSSTGLAVDLFTPIGPLNFSIAQNLTKADSDKTESFQFNLGTTF